MAPVMSVNVVSSVSERAHCHVRPVTPPSVSSSVAVISLYTSGTVADSSNAPGSSRLLTLTVSCTVASTMGVSSVSAWASLPSDTPTVTA